MLIGSHPTVSVPMNDQTASTEEWLRWVVDRYQGPLIRIAYRITGNLEVAREVTQDTFLRLCRQEQRLVNGQLASWLFTVCRNRSLDVLKKERRLQPVEDEDFWFPDGRGTSPDVAAARHDSYNLVRSIMKGLSKRDSEVLRLKFEYGMSYREIAEALEITESNVGFILHNTVRKIRKQLRSVEDGSPKTSNRLMR